MALAAEVKAALLDIKSDVEVHADRGFVRLETRVPLEEQREIVAEMERIVKSIPGVKNFDIKVVQKVKLSDGRLFP
jgi:hypothetical protein